MRLANGHLSPLAFNPGSRDRPPAWQAGDVAGGGADHPSPVQCRLVWEDTPSTPTSPSACFLAHDTDGVAPLLCLHSAHRATLTMLAGLRGPGGATATQRPALTALPLEDAPHALRGGDPSSVPPARRCVLVLEPGTGALRALAGPRHHLARLCLPGRQSGRRSVTAIADPAGCEVTMATDGGTRLRVSFHLRPSCPAVAAALAAVAEAAGHGAGLELQTAWLQALGPRVPGRTADEELAALCRAALAWPAPRPAEGAARRDQGTGLQTPQRTGTLAWSRPRRSPWLDRLDADGRGPAQASLPIAPLQPRDSGTIHPAHDTPPSAQTTALAGALVDALHAVAEDCALCTLRARAAPRLHAAARALAEQSSLPPPVPGSLAAALAAALDGVDGSRAGTPSFPAPVLVRRRSRSVAASVDVLDAYLALGSAASLTGPPGATAPAQGPREVLAAACARAMGTLGARGWTPARLQELRLEVRLPLLQAARICRVMSLHQGWDPAALTLIGRLDAAANHAATAGAKADAGALDDFPGEGRGRVGGACDPAVLPLHARGHEATILAVLLGMAASRRGLRDAAVSKMLLLHLPSRHPSTYPDLEIPASVQGAALIGLGLVHLGSCHRRVSGVMSEVVMAELERPMGAVDAAGPQPEGAECPHTQRRSEDREAYSLAAGLALGLIHLSKGTQALGHAELDLDTRLWCACMLARLMLGGMREGTVGRRRPGKPQAPGAELGVAPDLFQAQVSAPAAQGRAGGAQRQAGGSVAADIAAAQASPLTVMEGGLLDLGTSCPAATLALGLAHLQTDDAAAAARFAMPESLFELDFVRPQHLLLRVAMRALVMWSGITPAEDWVMQQLPRILQFDTSKMLGVGRAARRRKEDAEAVCQAHISCIAGACLAVGLRHAGSCSAAAAGLLRSRLEGLLRLKAAIPELNPDRQGWALGRVHVEEAVDVLALSLAIVMAGSGHSATLGLLRGLSLRSAPHSPSNALPPGPTRAPSSSLTYGAHTAVGMALGFLFLGQGRLTFGTRPLAVASLLCAVLPPFPLSSQDQRASHQVSEGFGGEEGVGCLLGHRALRHLYAMAAEPRCLNALDVRSGVPVYVPLTLTLAGEEKGTGATALGTPTLQLLDAQLAGKGGAGGHISPPRHALVAPGLLPAGSRVAELRVDGPRYHRQSLAGAALRALYRRRYVWVQGTGCALPYADDPGGVRSLLARAGRGGAGRAAPRRLADLARRYGELPWVAAFAAELCDDEGAEDWVAAWLAPRDPKGKGEWAAWARGSLLATLGQGDVGESLPLALEVLQAARTGPGGPSRNGATASDLGAAMRHSLLTSGFGQRLTAAQGEANHDPGLSLVEAEAWQPVVRPEALLQLR
ncbi:hypothetical protein APUTEX25_004271 [Auxenochlorella protothecoides]|uniref:Uncharacterized protein n=1 Tax=Auxenochlorella protothecoides TaxID=3075 RepID=A0A3M7L4C4_AUXPR|nr:hypothetical protein APUTEX25_004271 [Auxenochlorella protothecoides]|eukprot:RMZ57437.1 hypothetical protein APUTEX25_004271 [Auxenochlorella protothecoides]